MRLPLVLTRVLQTRWFDLRRPDTRDAVALLVAAAVAYVVAYTYDLAPKLFQLGIDYAEWELDDAIFVMFVMSIAMMVYAFRRSRPFQRNQIAHQRRT
jgi:uncharacterized membrane protein YkvA (DUF1232 family)